MKNSRGSAIALMSPFTKPMSESSNQELGTRIWNLQLERSTNSKFRIPNSKLQRPRDAAVFPHAPEVDRHQHRDAERQTDAVQHVESQQCALADERSTEEREPRIVGRVDERH